MIRAQEPVAKPTKRKAAKPGKGHNSAPIQADSLKSFADRIDRLEEEKKAISGSVKDLYKDVKGAGYNTKALRKVLAERRRKSDADLAADMEAYRAALGVPGATYRAVAEQLGVSKSKLQRLVPRDENGTTPAHHPETGEIIETDLEVPSGRDAPSDEHSRACGGVEGHAASTPEMAAAEGSEPLVGQPSGDRPLNGSAPRPAAGVESGPQDTPAESGGQLVASPAACVQPVPTASLPLVATEREAVAATPAEPKSLYQRITGSFTDIPREPPKAAEAKANHPPQGAASVAAGDDWPVMPEALRRSKDEGVARPSGLALSPGERNMEGGA